jgi:hypothetical protein
MIYTLADKLTKVSQFIMSESSNMLVQDGVLTVNTQKFDVSPMLLKKDITNDNLWIKDSKWENYLLQISDNSLKKLDFNIGLNGKISNVITIFKENVLSCFSVVKKEVIVNFPITEQIKNYISDNENLFFQVETTLKSLSLLTGEYEWEVDLGGYGEIDKILGISAGILWVWLNGYQIVGIEITTGNINHHFLPFKEIFEDGKFYFNFPHFEEEEDKIYFFERNYWIEIDLKSQKTKILWQGQEENINLSVFTKDYIYFISSPPHSVYSNRIGVFDKSAKKIVWSTQIALDTFITLNQIQVSEDKIYVLDSGGTLHIFEKEA